MSIYIDCDKCHDTIVENMKPEFGFREDVNVKEYRKAMREKFIEISCIDKIEQNVCPNYMEVEIDEMRDGYRFIRFVFESEKDSFVPCYLLIPDTGKKKYPVAIVMQGHSEGMTDSIGVAVHEEDKEYQPRGAFALQAVKNGFIALCVEQRGMGERRSVKKERLWGGKCSFDALTAILIGRTITGERVWDIKRAIDSLAAFPKCDLDKILITGNSGGGTTSYYAACYDERIKLSVPSCAFCTYKESILNVYHCSCNYMPRAYEFFDMQDLSVLIAPRRLIVVAGEKDTIFTLKGVKEGFETVKSVYKKSGAENKCKLVITPDGHYWREDIVWKAIVDEAKAMGWL